MQAIVFANRTGAELAPLDQYYCPAMLPMGGKVVIEHCLDELQVNGIQEVYLVVDTASDAIRQQLETGHRWSLNIHYILSRANESPDQVRRRLGNRLKTPFLALRGDMLRGLRCWNSDDVTGCAWLDEQGAPLGVQRINREPVTLSSLDWPLTTPPESVRRIASPVTAGFSDLSSLAEYHRAALSAADTHTELSSNGLLRGVRLRAGRQSEVHHRSLVEGFAQVGDYSRIHPEARFCGSVAIGHHCLIDRGARLHNSVVLDHTYVGAGLSLENAIACRDRIIRVDLGADLPVSDAFLLADCRSHCRTRLSEQLLALCLLLLSLPLWPLTALTALLSRPLQPLVPINLQSNRIHRRSSTSQPRQVRAWRWAVPWPFLAALPMLLAVITGDLRLLGRSAFLSSEQAEDPSQPWLAAHARLPFGLFSPASLLLGSQADPQLRQLLEIELLGSAHQGGLWLNWLRGRLS